MKKRAVVSGVTGQDGFLMTEVLLRKGYEVLGISRKQAELPQFKNKDFSLETVDFQDYRSLMGLIKEVQPDEVYNFAAQSSSINSWDDTLNTLELNLMAPAAIMQAIRDYDAKCKLFQALSCEMFGSHPTNVPQNELTGLNPETPYSSAKAGLLYLIKNYREKYGLFLIGAIFYNHESYRRNINFLSAKVAQSVANIKLNKESCLYVGNMDSKRDFGSAIDYMEAAWRVMQLWNGGEYIFATGELHSVREMIELAFKAIHVDIIWKGQGENEIGVTVKGDVLVRVNPAY